MRYVRRYAPAFRDQAVRMVREHETEHPSKRAAIAVVAGRVGCSTVTLRGWVRRAERDAAERAQLTEYERRRLRELERENRELRQANLLLRKTTMFFAQAAFDHRTRR